MPPLWRVNFAPLSQVLITLAFHVGRFSGDIAESAKSGRSFLPFPVGGDRFRPCIEDVLEMLVVEFNITRKQTWKRAINDGRRRWHELQLSAAIRDNPERALLTLQRLGLVTTD